jgi:DNA polymerase III subunit delta'
VADEAPSREHDQIDGVGAPEQTTTLIGHSAERAAFLQAFDAGRLHHAWLIHGPRGIGKATFAFELAREILRRTADEAAERVVRQVAEGAHPNLRVVRRRRTDKGDRFYTEIVIEDVRGLIGYFRHTSGRSGTRIAIVDAVEEMSPGAANALLKTLEEPPASGLILLISHRPGLVLPTIRSRCRALALRPVSDANVRAVVADTAIDADGRALDQAVSLANGRPRKALEALVLGETGALSALAGWLDTPQMRVGAAHLPIAAELSRGAGQGAYPIALDMISGWIAARARSAATAGTAPGAPLAMLADLWENANALASDQAVYNLDRRQTLVMVMDAIRDLDDRI